MKRMDLVGDAKTRGFDHGFLLAKISSNLLKSD